MKPKSFVERITELDIINRSAEEKETKITGPQKR